MNYRLVEKQAFWNIYPVTFAKESSSFGTYLRKIYRKTSIFTP